MIRKLQLNSMEEKYFMNQTMIQFLNEKHMKLNIKNQRPKVRFIQRTLTLEVARENQKNAYVIEKNPGRVRIEL